MKRNFFQILFGVLILLVLTFSALGAIPARAAWLPQISLTSLGTPYTQNFDTLSSTAGTTTNALTIDGWYLTETGGGARDNEWYAVDSGTSNTGDTYSYGTASATDRALGSLRSGTLIPVYGASFTNNSGSTVTTLDISYTGEEWRLGTVTRTDQINFDYSLNATDLTTGTWIPVPALNFVTPDTVTTGAKNGNAAAERSGVSGSITGLSITNGANFWIRWTDTDASGADDGLAVDDFSITPQASATPTLSIGDVTLDEGNPPGTTIFTFTVTLSLPADVGGVSFDIATADGTAQDGDPVTEDNDYIAQSLTGQAIPSGSTGPYNFSVSVNRDTTIEPDETFYVNITNITGANGGDTQGLGTITNDDIALSYIHDVQGSGAASPLVGHTVMVEGVVIADFQASNQLQGFFLQEQDADADADPATSEGVLVYCNTCPTAVAEGQRVRVTGIVSEFNNMTEITASSAPSVVVTDAGDHLAEITPSVISLPIAGDVDAFYEAREGMLVTFSDILTVSEYFEMARYGQIVLYQGNRPHQYTDISAPGVAGNIAYLDTLARRRVILDDDNNAQEAYLLQPNGSQAIYYPHVNGGFSVGTQGSDFFRGGDLVNGLTGVLHWSYPGFGANTWRIRPTAAHPITFTTANPRPVTPPAVGGSIKAAGMNLLNYFTTIDTTASSSSGPCGPSNTMDCRGADSVAELNRQRERASIVICTLDADVYALMEVENTTATDTINDLLGAVNARCGGSHPYNFVNTGGTLGSDAIRVALIYRTGILSPVGSSLVDLDPIHNRPPTAQTFDVVDVTNASYGARFTVIANHFKSKGCPGSGADADAGDGQGCYNGTRIAQANRLLTWVNSTVIPAAGDTDVLLLGDFNSYAQEDPVTTLTGGGFTDLASDLLGTGSYSYLFDGQLGHLDYAFASTSLTFQITGISNWHINADEADLFDYNDEILDPGEASFEEKPDGSALVPPRIVFQPASPYRASDHDPVLVGLDLRDNIAPIVNSFTAASPSSSLNISITAFTASDNISVTGYLITQSTTPPTAGDPNWLGTKPSTYTVGSAGIYSLYPWAVDAAGNVSALFDPPAVVTVSYPSVTINQAAGQADPTSSSPIHFTAVFTSPVTGFTGSDVTLSASTTGGALSAIVTGGPSTYTVAVSGMTGGGTVIATIGANVTTEGNSASTSVDNAVTYIYNVPPVITEGASVNVTMSEDGNPTPFALTLNATDANLDPLTWSILTQASHGTASVGPGTGIVSYTPVLNYLGLDSFVVQVSDGNGGTDSIIVNVTILDTSSPTVTNVSSTSANGTYRTGAVIPITITFSEAVIVTGMPQLTLETGAIDRAVDYTSGSGTATLTFNYTVQNGDSSTDLDYVSSNALALNGGTIRDAAANDAMLTLPAPGAPGSLGANKEIEINPLWRVYLPVLMRCPAGGNCFAQASP